MYHVTFLGVGLYLWYVFFFSFFKLLFDNVEEEQIESILFLDHILCQEVLPYTLHKERAWCQFSYGKRNRWTVHLGGISILYLHQWHCALKTARQCFLFVSLKLYMWCLYALMVNLMSKSNYMLAKSTLARSRCRTLDDGLLNRLALNHDVMQSKCAKTTKASSQNSSVYPLACGWLAGWLVGFEMPPSKMLTSQAAFICK